MKKLLLTIAALASITTTAAMAWEPAPQDRAFCKMAEGRAWVFDDYNDRCTPPPPPPPPVNWNNADTWTDEHFTIYRTVASEVIPAYKRMITGTGPRVQDEVCDRFGSKEDDCKKLLSKQLTTLLENDPRYDPVTKTLVQHAGTRPNCRASHPAFFFGSTGAIGMIATVIAGEEIRVSEKDKDCKPINGWSKD